MAMQDQDFWRRAGEATPGMLNLGVGLWGNRAARKEGEAELAKAQGPEYQRAMQASQGALASAGSMDPKAAAAERFGAAQGLLKGKDAADEAALMRMLQSKGLLGLSSFDPGQAGAFGVTTAGGPINPIAAAHFAARNARNADMAYKSLNEGEAQIGRMLDRSGALQTQANNQRANTLNARGTIPSKAAGTSELLKGALGIAKETGILKNLPGMIRGLWGTNKWFTSMDPDSIDW